MPCATCLARIAVENLIRVSDDLVQCPRCMFVFALKDVPRVSPGVVSSMSMHRPY